MTDLITRLQGFRARCYGDERALLDDALAEIERLRAAAQQARAALSLAEPALELGLDALRESADRYHSEMAGYRAWMHAAKEGDYTSAEIAWKAVREVLKETP